MIMMIIIIILILIILLFSISPLLSFINRIRWGNTKTLFQNDVILLTGASGGIGCPLSLKLLEHAPKGLILWDTNNITLEKLYQQFIKLIRNDNETILHCIYYNNQFTKLYEYNPNNNNDMNNTNMNKTICIFIEADVTDPTILTKTLPITQPYFPSQISTNQCPITMLINNAGIIRPISPPSVFSVTELTQQNQLQQQQLLSSTLPQQQQSTSLQNHIAETYELQQLMYNVNTHAPVNLAHSLLHLHSTPLIHSTLHNIPKEQSQLQIITIASAASMSYSSQLSAYCGSKAAVVQSLRALRFEHQRLLYDNYNPIKLPPPQILPTPNTTTTTTTSPTMSKSIQQQLQLQQSTQPHSTPNYLTVPGGTHLLKIIALFKSILYQLLPMLSTSRTTPYTYKDHNLLIQPTPHVHWSTIMPWHIDTYMFHNIHSSPLIQLFVPSLTSEQVAEYIRQQLITQAINTYYYGSHSTYHEAILPWLLTFTPLFSLLPIPISDFLVGYAGGWHAMDDWHDPRIPTTTNTPTSTIVK